MNRIIRCAALLIVASITLTSLCSCSLSGAFTSSYMRPPRLEGEKEALQLAFEKAVGNDVILKTPLKGKYQSSFILYDVDGDGSDEAFVSYALPDAQTTVRLHILSISDGEWVSAADIKSSGSAVYSIEFIDFNLNGMFEIVITWSLFENKNNKLLTIIDVRENVLNELVFTSKAHEYCSFKSVADIDTDGFPELLLVFLDDSSAETVAKLRCFDMLEDSTVEMSSELVLDPSALSVYGMNFDNVTTADGSIVRVFVDLNSKDSGVFTEVIKWSYEKSSLVRVIPTPSVATHRECLMNSWDIDSDGRLEIPVTSQLVGKRDGFTVSEENGTQLYFLDWFSFGEESPTLDSSTVYNSAASYCFLYSWEKDEVTVAYNSSDDCVDFYLWDAESENVGDLLFSLYYFGDVSKVPEGCSLVYAASNGNYWCSITESGSERGISLEFITANLIIV